MTQQSGEQSTEQEKAAQDIEEVKRLYAAITATLSAVLARVHDGDLSDVDLLPRQMLRLNDVTADIRKKQEAFNERFNDGAKEGDIDFDRMRFEIGCRLNRIRTCCHEE